MILTPNSYEDAKDLAAHIAHYLGSSKESGGELFTMYFGNSSVGIFAVHCHVFHGTYLKVQTADVYDMFKVGYLQLHRYHKTDEECLNTLHVTSLRPQMMTKRASSTATVPRPICAVSMAAQ